MATWFERFWAGTLRAGVNVATLPRRLVGGALRVLLVNKYWRRQGGVEQWCMLLQSMLESHGHEVVPFSQLEANTSPTPWSEYFVTEVDPIAPSKRERARAASRAIRGRDTTLAIRRLLDDVKIDLAHVVHTYHQLGPMFMSEFAKRTIPVVLSVHDYKLCCPSYRLFDDSTNKICTRCLEEPSQRVSAPARVQCWRGSTAGGLLLGAEALAVNIRKPYHHAGAVTVSNDLMRRCAEAAGLLSERIHTVPNYWPDDVSAGGRPVNVAGRPIFLGRLVIEKGVDVLIKAAAISGIGLDIVGEGPLRGSLERLAADLRAPVTFHGGVWGQEVEQLLAKASMMVVPSTWHEVSPLVVYQAMAMGLPVIASDVGGLRDLLDDERGCLVPAGDPSALAAAMVRAQNHPGLRLQWAASALQHSRTELSYERFIMRIRDVYASVGVTL